MTKTAQRRQAKEEKSRVLRLSLLSMLAGFSSAVVYLLAEFMWANGNQWVGQMIALIAAASGAYVGMKASWLMKKSDEDDWPAHHHKTARAARHR